MKHLKIYTLLLVAFLFSISEVVFAQNQIETQYLSGTDKDNLVEWDFKVSYGMNSKKWTKIGVPSCWELQGFGNYNYGRDYKAGKEYHDEHGLYKHKFSVPKEWKNKEVKIVFEGVMTDAEVKINGKLAGEIHQGAFYEFKYSITKLLKYGGENLIEVKVNKMSSNKSINSGERNTDFWIFGGIYRPVYLQAFPKEHIERVAIDAKANGTIKAELFTNSKKAVDTKFVLLDDKGNKIQDLSIDNLVKENGKWIVSTSASNIQTWNQELPKMYQLQISLLDKKGTVLHTYNQKIGFRTVEVREGDGIYVNNKRIKFKGVNRHSFHPESGRTTSKALSIEHIKMMKDMNMNAVRMSHYPPDVHFLEACDSLGLFVLDELCTWHTPYLDTEVGKKLVKETVVRDVNHPSILIWDNGNETGWNTELDDEFAKWDIQKREVIHPWGIFKKTNTFHYLPYHGLAYDGYVKDKISFPTEFLHGLYDGGHGAGLDEYWKVMWNLPLSAGGFLWDFADEAVVRTDKNGILDADGNHAPDGIVGPYGEKEGSYFTIKEVWSPIYIEERNIREGFNGVFRVENRYHFTNLDACTMQAKWVSFEGPNGSAQEKVISERSVSLPSLAPENKGTFKVDLPQNWKNADVLYLTATNQHGMEIFTWSYPVKLPQDYSKISYSGNGEISTKSNTSKIEVSTNKLDLTFSSKTGEIEQVVKNGVSIPLSKGPVLLGTKSKLDTVYFKTYQDKVEVIALYQQKKKYWDWKDNNEMTQDFIKWTIHPNSLVDLQVSIIGTRKTKDFYGITFSFPEKEVAGMKWLGDGPYRVWRNRMKGTQLKVWENDYNNTITGESGYVYPEFKGYFSSIYWAKLRGNNNNGFNVYCHSNHTFLRMLTPEQPADVLRGASVTKFPSGDISFVKNIPPIGTKFKEIGEMGPTSNAEMIFGNDDEPIVIDLTFEF
ncbi:glycoside hydrolase family 2 TIM barrel-domain containing protein [Lutibacter sp. TH_r2]|uniref:glycoside hydrolase family 2 protein n=1 Tax=Lutibacter sp. TH_r2 TaxID=3082083 RepID=UPI0029536F14|nr:glycoside hydrolase family 2 TIM barrel-domain containing protein [Lutibacter sp. TH_r2]MDV7185914.1 glycoside hydrolase family 2 TIM barrel-domain containing protein [Lutibacter sp. TH_r2]